MPDIKTVGDIVTSARKAREQESVAKHSGKGTPGQTEAKATFKAVNVDDHGVIVGIGASISVDREDDAVQKGALLGLAYEFCASKGREFRANHDPEVVLDAELVASWPGAPILKSGTILQPGQEIPSDDPVVGINIEKGKETHWFVSIRPKDKAIVDAARKGEIVGFSWGGMVLKSEE